MDRTTCAIPVASLSPAKGIGLGKLEVPNRPRDMSSMALFTCPQKACFCTLLRS